LDDDDEIAFAEHTWAQRPQPIHSLSSITAIPLTKVIA
jgi:hypothetical protein